MSELDKMLHALKGALCAVNFKRVPMPVERRTVVVEYYYCEERLYLLRFEDGTFALACGSSPFDAWHNWILKYEHKLEKEDNE